MWLIEQEDEVRQITEAFNTIPSLYIADGHHRTASSNFLYQKMKSGKNQKAKELSKYFMAYFIPESNLSITSFLTYTPLDI